MSRDADLPERRGLAVRRSCDLREVREQTAEPAAWEVVCEVLVVFGYPHQPTRRPLAAVCCGVWRGIAEGVRRGSMEADALTEREGKERKYARGGEERDKEIWSWNDRINEKQKKGK